MTADGTAQPIKGILFDMDGVLMDSEPVITRAIMEILRERYGLDVKKEDFRDFVGMGEDRYIGGTVERYGRSYEPEMKRLAYERYALLTSELRAFPGTAEALEGLRDRGLLLAVCSSSDEVKLRLNLEAGKLAALFSAIVSGDRAARKKPYPDLFELGAEELGLPPCACAVVEDSLAGLAAAKAAGCLAVGLTTSFPREALLAAGADAVIDTVSELAGAILP